MSSAAHRGGWGFLLAVLVASSHAAAEEPPSLNPPMRLKLPAIFSAPAQEVAAGDSELRQLLKARFNEALAEAKHVSAQGSFGRGGANDYQFLDIAKRLIDSAMELTDEADDRLALLAQYVELTRSFEQQVQVLVTAQVVPTHQLHRARYHRLDAEIRFVRAKEQVAKLRRGE